MTDLAYAPAQLGDTYPPQAAAAMTTTVKRAKVRPSLLEYLHTCIVSRLGREMQSLSGPRSKPDELMRVLIAQRTYARFTLAM